ncbi:heme-binding protein [Novosphingobium sp. LASN5T]|uniref:GlcG/HbpS family heme-binding protein n=1 Tax=Novosphingobium sp. LASN5T TaxID=2491021 RepID=UPI000F5E9A1D|nr:heme-binding protein [Novosphingobium sp. LASN5T]RQW41717.1 heme-binding protein [Novosphingobium sp. LASN5T]
MISRPCLAVSEIDRIMEAARIVALADGFAVTICIVDDGGHLLRLDRLEGAPLVSLRVAEGKARTAVELNMSTASLEQAVSAMPSIIAIAGLHPFRGGIPLYHDGHCVGAIGVSGALPDQDEHIALSGAHVLTA